MRVSARRADDGGWGCSGFAVGGGGGDGGGGEVSATNDGARTEALGRSSDDDDSANSREAAEKSVGGPCPSTASPPSKTPCSLRETALPAVAAAPPPSPATLAGVAHAAAAVEAAASATTPTLGDANCPTAWPRLWLGLERSSCSRSFTAAGAHRPP
jgi:hypothetical protein